MHPDKSFHLPKICLHFVIYVTIGYFAWWSGGDKIIYALLYRTAALVLPTVFDGNIADVRYMGDGAAWFVQTGLGHSSRHLASFTIEYDSYARLLTPLPMFFAMLLALPWRRPLDVVAGLLLYMLSFLLALCGGTWHLLALMLTEGQHSIFGVVAPIQIQAPPWPEWVFHLSSLGFLFWLIMPYPIAPMICIILFRRQLGALIRNAAPSGDAAQ